MSIKLALLKTLGTTALVGLGAHLANKNNATVQRRRKKTCTPCAAMADVNRARQSAKTGQL